jgi:Bacteriophage tail sheath protein
MYQHPGVYIEEIPSGARPIEAAGTSTALIAGYTTKGPLNTPTLLFSFDQYVSQFGGIADLQGSTIGQTVDYMGHTAQAFFGNGGTKAYIVRLAHGSSAHPVSVASAKLIIPLGSVTSSSTSADIKNYLNIEATSAGAWANKLEFRAESIANSNPQRYKISIGRTIQPNKFVASEVFTDVSLDPNEIRDFVSATLNGISPSVRISAVTNIPDPDKKALMVASLTSGDLSAFTAFSGLANKGFKVTLGTDAIGVSFGATAPNTFQEVADKIQSDVRGTADATTVRGSFTCSVENGRLVLRARGIESAVTVAPPDPPTGDAIATLKLDVGASGADKATAITGDKAFVALFSATSAATLDGGADGGLPDQGDYDSLMPELKKLRDISIILLPGQVWSQAGNAIISDFQAHAELMKNRMLIIDPTESKRFTTSQSFIDEGFPTSTYTVTYYPWIEVANPYYHPELRPNRPRTVFVPPSGFAAGLWAKTDGRRGVWKAPAGLQASLIGAANTAVKIGDDEQDQLNPVGVNCFRRIISDIVIWGSRTLATKADPEWRYVPVRRTAMMLEESIYQGIQWAVFEPNDHRLWSSLRLNIGAFMDTLFRAGAFQGEKASDAYFVRCGLGDTMTQAEIDAGQVIVLVGFAPLKPAEFVIVRIQQIVGKQ